MKKIKYRSRYNLPKPVITKNYDTNFVEIDIVKDVKVIDRDNDIYEIVDKVVEKSKINLEDLTQSYKGQTGLEAVMKRVAITGDISLLNTISSDVETPVVDATKIPTSLGAALSKSKEVQTLFDSLPNEIKMGKTPEEIASNFTTADLEAYIARLKAIKETKDNGGNDNEQ